MKKIIYASVVGLISSYAFASGNGSFNVQDDLSSGYYAQLAPPPGTSSNVKMKSNPDGDSWYLDGAYAPPNGGQAHYSITSPDEFNLAGFVTIFGGPHFYNSEANIGIDIYDDLHHLVTQCSPNPYYWWDNGNQQVWLYNDISQNDISYCQDPIYYIQDDRGKANPSNLYVHTTGASSFSVQNNLSSGYSIELNSASMQSNPDNDSWYLSAPYALSGKQAGVFVFTPDDYKIWHQYNSDGSKFDYNSEAILAFSIYNQNNSLVTTCKGDVYYLLSEKFFGHGSANSIPSQAITCKNSSYVIKTNNENWATLYVENN